MLITDPDFASACADLDGRPVELAVSHEKPTTRMCPKCERNMSSCRVDLAPTGLHVDVMRCTSDGLWCERGLLERIFANVSRKRPGYPGSNYARTLSKGPDGLPVPQAHSRGTGLYISEWRNRPRHRKPTLTPINAYADRNLACPTCTRELVFFGDRYACGTCGGTFVQNAAFEAMVMDVSKEFFQMPVVTGAGGPRNCPVCTNPMVIEPVENVPIDRCGQHGIWFDPNELTVALERASGQFDTGWRAWLKRVFT